jgi:hypothetical protein
LKTRSLLSLLIILTFALVTLSCATFGAISTEAPVDNEAGDLIATSVVETLEAQATPFLAVMETATMESAAETPLVPTNTPDESPAAAVDIPLTVVYIDQARNVWVWQENGEARQITTSSDVERISISDDAAWVAYTRTIDNIQYSLWAVELASGTERVLMDTPDFDVLPREVGAISVMPMSFSWVPNTHILAFNTRPSFEGPGLMLNNDLWLANAESGEVDQLLSPGSGGQFHFSPDGTQIAIARPDSIHIVNTDGGNLRENVLTFTEVSTYSEFLYYPTLYWSADSSYLRVAIPPQAHLDDLNDPTTIWHIPADGAPAHSINSVVTAGLIDPIFSPDLEKIAYLRQEGDPADNRRELRIASAEGAEDTAYLTEDYLHFIAWSADATRFAFTAGENNRPYLGQEGAAPQALTDTPMAMGLRWVDETRFLFIAYIPPRLELRLGTIEAESDLIFRAPGEVIPFINYDFAP